MGTHHFPTPTSARYVRDIFIEGPIIGILVPCSQCNQQGVCVRIDRLTLPDGIDPDTPSLLMHQDDELGITCGCYGKAHRQIAHILAAQARRADARNRR